MLVLGICNDETASACLMRDGEVIAAVSEERFTRVKMHNTFPVLSIEYCLNSQGLSTHDLDAVAYAWAKGVPPNALITYVERSSELAQDEVASKVLRDRIFWENERNLPKIEEFRSWVGTTSFTSKTKILDFFHHEAHAASASLLSPFDSGLVVTADGRGDFESTTIWNFDRAGEHPLQQVFSASSLDSLGYFYGRITALLGFKPMRHEGKITGLAAFGDPKPARQLCRDMIEVVNGKLRAEPGENYLPFFEPLSEALVSKARNFRPEDLAAAAQAHLESMLVNLIQNQLSQSQKSAVNLMVAGGVFANVRVNQVLKELPEIEALFVQPQMGDGGLCLGAAALATEQLATSVSMSSNSKSKYLSTMYLGPTADFNFDLAKTTIPKENEVHSIEEAPKKLVRALMSKQVVGLIHGRMEFGPRALCNRSIIFGTSDVSANDWLNQRMNRTEFMPFAPVVRQEVANKAFEGFDPSDVTLRFMTSTVKVTKKFQEVCPAVVHVDGTARPQIVTKDSHNFIWQVLSLWEESTGEMSLINTSFNAHEQPIVCNLDDGLAALSAGTIDELWFIDGRVARVFYSN